MENYEELGLTKNESKVYETLVKFEKLGSAEISANSGVSYSKIYNVLSSLIKKGLVSLIPEKSKKFAPASPDFLIKFIEQKEEKLRQAKEKAKEMKKFYEIQNKNPVIMGIGKDGFYKIIKEEKKVEKYEYSIKWTSDPKPEWIGSRERNMKKGIDFRDLVRYDKETKENVTAWLEITNSIKEISNKGIAMSVIDDEEVMLSLIKSNVTLLIKDKPFAEIMKKLFLAYYDKAEKIK